MLTPRWYQSGEIGPRTEESPNAEIALSAPISSRRVALLTSGAAASHAMLWRASSRPRRERWKPAGTMWSPNDRNDRGIARRDKANFLIPRPRHYAGRASSVQESILDRQASHR